MKKITTFGLLSILVLLASFQAKSQIKSSATQTVTFAVIHSAKHTLNALVNSQDFNFVPNSSEKTTLKNPLEKKSFKVTVAGIFPNTTASKVSSNNHTDIKSILQEKNSVTFDGTPTLVTVTE